MKYIAKTLCGSLVVACLLHPAYAQEPMEKAAEITTTDHLEASESKSDHIPVEDLRAFAEAYERIKREYVEPTDDKKLLADAIRGMLNGLDPHSTFLDEESLKNFEESTSGQFGGLGIEVAIEDGFLRIISPIDDSPAEKAGIRSGDWIIKIDDVPVKSLTPDDAIGRLRGEIGTDIELTVLREGAESQTLNIKITRGIIQAKSVKARLLEPGYIYTRVSQFQEKTAEEFKRELDKLMENDTPVKGLILDLRNNPGGLMDSAVTIAGSFLDGGLVVYTKGRQESSRQNYQASAKDILQGVPIVVLVNGGSASASEVVAGALQDRRRAVIVGQRTFGKGSVQSLIPMENDHRALKITIARYYTPNGRSIQAEGIEPDITLDPLKLTAVDNNTLFSLREADLAGHLKNEKNEKNESKEGKNPAIKGSSAEKENLALTDYELYESLNLLKGMARQQANQIAATETVKAPRTENKPEETKETAKETKETPAATEVKPMK